MGLADRAGALLWPERCILCGAVVAYGEDCCPRCKKSTLFLDRAARCGAWEAVAVWEYQGRAARALSRFKFQGDMDAGRKIARRMAAAWEAQCPDFGAELITFVPMPPERERRRGYNQAELLARWTGEALGLLVLPLLERRGTMARHQMAPSLRRKGDSSFFLLPGAGAAARGRRILLVDDVITTGGTARACAGLLRDAGAEKIGVLAAARWAGV